MSARDELMEVLNWIPASAWDMAYEIGDLSDLADAILAAGYRKPRTVTTAAELEALPAESIVMAGDEIYRRVDIRLCPEETFKCLDEAIDVREHQTYRAETLLWQGLGGTSAIVLFEPEVTE